MSFNEIQNKIQNALMLDFGQIFSESIELFKKVWLQGFIMMLIMMAFTIPFLAIVYIPLLFLGIADISSPDAIDGLAPFALILALIAYLLFIFAMIVISFGLKAGLYRIIRQKDMNDVGTDDYLYFLRGSYLRKTINLSMSYFGISLVATLLCYLPIIYVSVPLSLMPVFYAFNPELSTSNIIKASFDLGNKKWFIIFGLTLVAGFMAMIVGALLCGFGIFLTASFAAIPVYFIYKSVIGFESFESEMTLIGENNPS